jgi:hypothetical protein
MKNSWNSAFIDPEILPREAHRPLQKNRRYSGSDIKLLHHSNKNFLIPSSFDGTSKKIN